MGTNIGNIDLPATSTTSGAPKTAAGSEMASSTRATAHATLEASARVTGSAEARLGLSVFANVNKSTHQVLVAERRHGGLSLLPSGIFHDATALHPSKSQSTSILLTIKTSHHPLPLTFHSAVARRLRKGPLRLLNH